jgi:CrcB protein
MLRYWAALYAGATWRTTLVVNVSGAFLIGLLVAAPLGSDIRARLLLASGFLGGYTTFSTWQLEALLSVRQGDTLSAVANLAVSVIAGFIAVLLGYQLGARLR